MYIRIRKALKKQLNSAPNCSRHVVHMGYTVPFGAAGSHSSSKLPVLQLQLIESSACEAGFFTF